MSNQIENKTKIMLLIAFALSGMTALVYEVVWTRPLQLIFGSTIYAVSTMLTTFFIGFALGSYLFRNIADKSKNLLLLFSILEFGIGVYGLIIIYIFKILPTIYISMLKLPGFQFLQFILCFLVLITPTTVFGAIWPVVNKAYVNQNELGKGVGILYSANSFGAFIGPLATGFVLLPILGIRATSVLAAIMNMLIAVVIFIYSMKIKKGGKHGA